MSICTKERQPPATTPTDPTSLESLLSRIADGDSVAFTLFYKRTCARVFGLCRRLIIDTSTAEDMTQEVFLEVWTKALQFDPARGSGLGWLLNVTHHRCVDRIRSIEASRRRDGNEVDWRQAASNDDVDHLILRAADALRLRVAMGQLSDLRREALGYAFFTDHSYQQASEALGIPLGTFKSRVRDGLRALGPLLKDVGCQHWTD